jgi:hypothetical protein
MELVDKAELADVTLEVLGRGDEATGTATTNRVYGGWSTTPDTAAVVRVGLRAGNYTALITGFSPPNSIILPWRGAAQSAAIQIVKWIKANHDTLIAKRAH